MKYRALVFCLLVAIVAAPAVAADQDDAEMSLGSVLVRSMEKVIVVAMDSGDEGSSGDGLVDRVFVYYLAEPLDQPLHFRTDRAMVLFGKGRVQVTSPDGPTILRFAVRAAGLDRPRPNKPGEKDDFCIEDPGMNFRSGLKGRGAARSISLENGVGLAHYPKVESLPFSHFEQADLTRLNYRDFLSSVPGEFDIATKCAPQCASGGPGSSGCSVSSCCSVTCQSGYYACCHCTNGCSCVKN